MNKPNAIHWFRQDLRLSDNPAFYDATKNSSILPIYILDDKNSKEFSMGEASRFWLHHSLTSLDKSLDENLSIYPIPGSSAASSAISISGFNDKYFFYGFLPKKEKELNDVLKNISNFSYCIIFFIPGSKVNFYLQYFKQYFFDRKILIAREITKNMNMDK